MRLDGFLTLKEVILDNGRLLTGVEAFKAGIVKAKPHSRIGWPKIGPGELPVGTNIHTDAGRQFMIYCWGGRIPVTDFVCSKFGLGTGRTPETTADTQLEAPLNFWDSGSGMQALKAVTGIDYPEPFIARVTITIATTEAQGVLISEMGLFSTNGTLLHRSVLDVPFNKGSTAKTYLWRLRF